MEGLLDTSLALVWAVDLVEILENTYTVCPVQFRHAKEMRAPPGVVKVWHRDPYPDEKRQQSLAVIASRQGSQPTLKVTLDNLTLSQFPRSPALLAASVTARALHSSIQRGLSLSFAKCKKGNYERRQPTLAALKTKLLGCLRLFQFSAPNSNQGPYPCIWFVASKGTG
jgi:hypothetical protein